MTRGDLAREIKESFRDPRALVVALGLKQDPKHRQQSSAKILCPVHAERSASCSVTNGPDGTVRFLCFGCRASGDALTLIAAAKSLNLKSQFKEVLAVACEVGGLWSQLAELKGEASGNAPRPAPVPRPELAPLPERTYPDPASLEAFWAASASVESAKASRDELQRRGVDAGAVARADLARVIPPSGLPRWARYQGKSWNETGHSMAVQVFDSDGVFRSVRAWRIYEGDTPKRLPPGGHKSGELVLANRPALGLLRGQSCSGPVVICEGEPDWLVRSVVNHWLPVIGIGSGSWHAGFAARIPYGCEVLLRTHRDAAGDAYADKILETLKSRAQVYRLVVEEPEVAA